VVGRFHRVSPVVDDERTVAAGFAAIRELFGDRR
jgi:hypothetical protein